LKPTIFRASVAKLLGELLVEADLNVIFSGISMEFTGV
jgi:hypothetical protein